MHRPARGSRRIDAGGWLRAVALDTLQREFDDRPRAAAELGWQATTPFVDGVRRYVDWLAETSGSPVSLAASSTAGSAATVRRQESAEL